MPPVPSNRSFASCLAAAVVSVLGLLLVAAFFQTCLSSRQLATNFVSRSTWVWLAQSSTISTPSRPVQNLITVPFLRTLIPSAIVALTALIAGAGWLVWRREMKWIDALVRWGLYCGLWWCLVDVWEWLWIAAGTLGLTGLAELLSATPQFWLAACLSGWITTFLALGKSADSKAVNDSKSRGAAWVWVACSIYFLVFTAMNWRLYFNLLVPHGDSVMYEEHLWNLLHGKGFRSYLDRGLFFGEHIQFVHLFLLPAYALWPSHLFLEGCSSAALALGAFPVFWMVRRHTNSERTATAVAVAYLLYTPTQFLDIEIDLKTFRPESFGIPLLLLTLDQLDRKHLIGTLVGIAFCLSVKEDYTLVFGPLGVWIAFASGTTPKVTDPAQKGQFPFDFARTRIIFGLSLSAFSVVYLWLATRVIMPWFRSGVELHYAGYFKRFGETPEEIVTTILTRPDLVFSALVTPETALYALAMLAPLAFLPLLAPTRLAVGLPLFAILCLIELEGPPTPQHQFHAPLVPIIFWSLAAALPRANAIGKSVMRRWTKPTHAPTSDYFILRHAIWTSALATGVFFSLSPLGIPFWDSGSTWYWKNLYGVNPRAEKFARIANLIPHSARVASTDFVHPRFTHHERSYDYSEYVRDYTGQGKRIPDDTDYLVIDTDHRYSKIKKPGDVPELRDQADQWELQPDLTDGYFIVLKRKPR